MNLWKNTLIGGALALATFALPAFAQGPGAKSGFTNLKVTVGAESSLVVNSTDTLLEKTDTAFGDFVTTVPTSLTYKIRTASGAKITASLEQFNAGGPTLANLSFVGTSSSPGTGVSDARGTISPSTELPVVTFGASANSAKSGNSASVSWNLEDDPTFQIGSYVSKVTFTISNT